MASGNLLDQRYHFLVSSVRKIYECLDSDETIVTVNAITCSGEDEMIVTSVTESGGFERRIVTDVNTVVQTAEAITSKVTVRIDTEDCIQ